MHAVVRLIYRYITKNKGRTLFIGFSIIVSAAMIFFLQLYLRDSSIDREIRYNNAKGGKLTCKVWTKDNQYMENIKDVDIVKNISYCLPIANQFNINHEQEKFALIGFEDNIEELLNLKLAEGRYPENNNEISLEKRILDSMVSPPKIGEKIKISDDKSGIELEYTLTGTFDFIYELDESKEVAIAYIKLDEAKNFLTEYMGKKEREMLYECLIETDNKVTREELDEKLGHSRAVIDAGRWFIANSIYTENKSNEITIIIISVIIVMSAILTLYNVFNSSIALKSSEYGMLRAVGMSDKELRATVVGEGVIIGFVFVAIGMLVGKIGYSLITNLLNIKYLNYGIAAIPVKEIILTYVFCIVGIILSVYESSRKVLQQTAIEQIRGNEYLGIDKLKRNNEREIGTKPKSFILDLAKCNIKRNRKTFKITVVSISMSIVFLLATFYMFTNLTEKKEEHNDFIIRSCQESQENQIKEDLIQEIKNIEGVQSVLSEGTLYQSIDLCENNKVLGKNGVEYIEKELSFSSLDNADEYRNKGYYYLPVMISECNMDIIENLKSIVVGGTIDDKEIQEEPTCILVQNINEEGVSNYKVGDKIKLGNRICILKDGIWDFPSEVELTISAILDEEKYNSSNSMINTVVIVSDKSGGKYLNKEGYYKLYDEKNVNIKLEDESYKDEITLKLNEIVNKDKSLELITKNDLIEKDKVRTANIGMTLYSLVVALAICSILNLFSIMSINMVLRKKEFAMFRAVGMSDKEIKRLILAESILYGGEGLKFGIGVGSMFLLILYFYMSSNIGMVCIYPFKMVIAIIIGTLLISLGAAANSWRIVLKEDIISSIRSVE